VVISDLDPSHLYGGYGFLDIDSSENSKFINNASKIILITSIM
jgi:hypothetical protein